MTGPDLTVLQPGTNLYNGRFTINECLGSGGFGITYRGYDHKLARDVAIKEYFPYGYVSRNVSTTNGITLNKAEYEGFYSEWKGKFLNEARALAQFSGVNGIVGVHEFFEESGTAYIIMDYLDGVTLKDYVKQNGKMPAAELCAKALPIMSALEKVHEKGIVHRDISPSNIMLRSDGTLTLFDFGAAREYGDNKELSVLVKRSYAPIEQYNSKGRQGAFTDVYAFCATLYYCITGMVPEESVERTIQDDLEPPSAYADVPAHINDAIMKGMQVLAKDRYQNIRELADALQNNASMQVKVHDPDEGTALLIDKDPSLGKLPPKGVTLPPPAYREPEDVSNTVALQNAPEKNGKVKKIVIGCAAGAALVGLSVGLTVLLLGGNNKKIETAATTAPTTTTSAVTTTAAAAEDTTVSETAAPEMTAETTTEAEPETTVETTVETTTETAPETTVATEDPEETEDENAEFVLETVTIAGKEYSTDAEKLSIYDDLTDDDIKLIGKFRYLQNLDISIKNVTNIKPLAKLKNLESLRISYGSKLEDINALSGLTELTSLKLSGMSSLKDISALSELTNIEVLELAGSGKLTDISPIGKLSELKDLHLSGLTRLEDISPIKECTGLTKLSVLECDRLEDFSSLGSLRELELLHISGSSIKSIAALTGLNYLYDLGLTNTDLTDISAVKTLPDLKYLTLTSNSRLTDISPLKNVRGLEKLDMAYCNITDLSPLEDHVYLKELNVNNNKNLTSLNGVGSLQALTVLHINDTGITDLSELRSLKNLEELYLSSGLSSVTNAPYLSIDIEPLKELTSLEYLVANLSDEDKKELLAVNPALEITDKRGFRVKKIG